MLSREYKSFSSWIQLFEEQNFFYFSFKGKILKNIPPHKNWSQGAREQLRAHGALQRIGSQHSCLVAHSCLALQLQEIPRPLLASMSPCTYMYTPTHRHAHIDITKNRKIKSNKTPVNQKQSETNILFSLLGVKSILICLLRRKNFKNIFNAFVCVSVWVMHTIRVWLPHGRL